MLITLRLKEIIGIFADYRTHVQDSRRLDENSSNLWDIYEMTRHTLSGHAYDYKNEQDSTTPVSASDKGNEEPAHNIDFGEAVNIRIVI